MNSGTVTGYIAWRKSNTKNYYARDLAKKKQIGLIYDEYGGEEAYYRNAYKKIIEDANKEKKLK
jgi:hypothetical protein